MAYNFALVLICITLSVIQMQYCKKLTSLQNKKTDIYREHILKHGYFLIHPCGRPPPGNVSRCKAYVKHPDCHSFPGKPRDVEITHGVKNNTSPFIHVTWHISTTGFSDLWGFQVRLVEVSFYHPMRYNKCTQINSKDKTWSSVQFQDLSFGAQYELRIQSMPPNHSNLIIKQVKIKEQCQIAKLKDRPACCTFSTVWCHVSDKLVLGIKIISINITWELNCKKVTQFKLKWMADNPNYSTNCSGVAYINNVTSFIIMLHKKCNTLSLNYTGQIFGITAEKRRTKSRTFQFAIPQFATEISIIPTTKHPSASNQIVIAIVVGIGTALGLLLVVLVFRILKRRDSPLIRLESRPVVDENDTDEMLSDPIKVLILHAGCCIPCKKVVYCLWDVLDSTNLFDIRLDMLSEPKLNENPLRWYETQIKDVTRVLLVTSRLMQMQDQTSETRINISEHDYVSVRFQLNLLRGDLCSKRDASKYVPVYMNYNGSKDDIPRFLSTCRAYKCARDLDKIMLHLLGLSSVRKHSRRPIVQVASDSHPFNIKRDAFEKAIAEAEKFHKEIPETSHLPNLQENLII